MRTALPHPRLLAGLLVAAVVTGGGVGWAVATNRPTAPVGADAAPTPDPVLTLAGQTAGRVPWDQPLTLALTEGTLQDVTVLDQDGTVVDGELSATGWSSATTLVPASTYRLSATVVDTGGRVRTLALNTRTTLPSRTLHAVLSPGDGKVVGVGLPVIVTLDRAVKDQADRAAVVRRLRVATTPSVAGAWRWMSPTELHYRGPAYWAKGTSITARADFTRLKLSDGTWGEGVRATTYSTGSSVISTVDVTRHVMDVVVDGRLVRTVKVSTGRATYPTKGGVHLVLEKTKLKVMDSSTVGIPRNSPAGYYEKVPNSVRISYSGEFVHSAGWSVRDQGVRNVSHGCVNISPADAAWFFGLVRRGDVVDVKNASVGPKLSDPGTSDWNIPFASWAN
jgi:lipoprotein-anchoring transpeptidase ErfK/SrfK